MQSSRRNSNVLASQLRGDTGAPALSSLSSSVSLTEDAPTAGDAAAKGAQRRHLSKPRRKARSLLRRWRALSIRHAWANPLALVLLVLTAYIYHPAPSNPFHAALFLSYRQAGSEAGGGAAQYGKGRRDLAFVGFYVLCLSFSREFLMQVVLRPLAIRYGIRSRSKQTRFMEQAYTAIYFSVFGPLGLYIMRQSPMWYFRTVGFFEEYPHRTLDGLFKAYYLLQAAYWAQQAIVLLLLLEKPRKDFRELVGHHILTLTLIILSYRFHFTNMGLAVYITHDISDFFLAVSKTLNYIDSWIVGPFFATFIGVWIYLRHYINLRILWCTLTEFRTIGPFKFDWAAEQYKSRLSQTIAFTLLASLQAVNLFWLYFILRIAKNYVFTSVAVDVRSEVEDNDDDVAEGSKALPPASAAGSADALSAGGSSFASGAAAADVSRRRMLAKGLDGDG